MIKIVLLILVIVVSKIRIKYKKVQGIYLWVNNTNNSCYVGKSVNLYQRLSKYLSTTYIQKNKNKMAFCGAIDKYGLENFTFYILERYYQQIHLLNFLSNYEKKKITGTI